MGRRVGTGKGRKGREDSTPFVKFLDLPLVRYYVTVNKPALFSLFTLQVL